MSSPRLGNLSGTREEVDLFDIIQFLVTNWKRLTLSALIGGFIGLLAALVLPERYEATASILGGRIVGREIENQSMFLERIESPTIYTDTSFAACDLLEQADPSTTLLKRLRFKINRESGAINVSVLNSTPASAKRCLEAILIDIKSSQFPIFSAEYNAGKVRLSQIDQKLRSAEQRKKDELSLYQQEVAEANARLMEIQSFLDRHGVSQTGLNVDDDKFSAMSLLVTTTLEKQNQASELKRTIDRLQQNIKSQFTTVTAEAHIDELQREVLELTKQLDPPSTKQAVFLVPVHASTQSVEPKRVLILAAGLVVGTLVGLCVLLLGVVKLKSREDKQAT